jgi:hypothetical protein
MEAKLIKVENTFYLKQDGTILGTSSYPNLSASIRYSLSLKNCEAIANGYDLDELADENYQNFWNILDYKERDIHTFGFIEGFQKALEILGDKKFSEEDVKKAMDVAVNYETNRDAQSYQEKIDFLKSLQQTEWDVEVEMDMILVGQCDCPCHSEGATIMHYVACCHPKIVDSPKLDANGCIILKRK